MSSFAQDATETQFNSARQCSALEEDLQEDPFTQALDKILGLDDEKVRHDDHDMIFDDLSFSEEIFEDLARQAEHQEEKDNRNQERALLVTDLAFEVESDQNDLKPKIENEVDTTKSKFPKKKKSAPKTKQPKDSDLEIPDGVEEMPKPKRSMNAYNFFFQAERKRLLQELPDPGVKPRRSHGKIGFAAMARLISSRWKKITDDVKMEYEQLAAIDGERYEKEMSEYKEWKRDNNIVSKKKHDTAKSKKPILCEDGASSQDLSLVIDEHEETILGKVDFDLLTFAELLEDASSAFAPPEICSSATQVSEESIELTPTFNHKSGDFSKFENVATVSIKTEETVKTARAVSASVSADTQKTQEKKREGKLKAKKNNKKKSNNHPTKSLSAYNIFFKMERKKLLESLPAPGNKPRRGHGKMGFANMAKHIAGLWKNITPKDKLFYEHLSALDAERYEKEVEAYKKKEAERHQKDNGNVVSNPMLHATATSQCSMPRQLQMVQPVYISHYVPVPVHSGYFNMPPLKMHHTDTPPIPGSNVVNFLRHSLYHR